MSQVSRYPSRRALLGLGGVAALGLTGGIGASAMAANPTPEGDQVHALGCPAGRDPVTESATLAAVSRLAKAAPRTLSTADAPPLASGRFCHLPFVSRAEWGADESLRFSADGTEIYPQTYWPVQTFTVHHTADGTDDSDPAAVVRAIYKYHTIDENFGDIGYNFLIDKAGTIYEGRYSGTDAIPAFDSSGQAVDAAHVGGYNAGNVGIALLGDYTAAVPTEAALQTLELLLRALTRWQKVDPLARVTYTNPVSAVTADVPAVSGHRDWASASTECPGDSFYPLLDQVRDAIAKDA